MMDYILAVLIIVMIAIMIHYSVIMPERCETVVDGHRCQDYAMKGRHHCFPHDPVVISLQIARSAKDFEEHAAIRDRLEKQIRQDQERMEVQARSIEQLSFDNDRYKSQITALRSALKTLHVFATESAIRLKLTYDPVSMIDALYVWQQTDPTRKEGK